MNTFCSKLLEIPFFKEILLSEDGVLLSKLLWFSQIDLEKIEPSTVQLWQQIFVRARSLGYSMSPEEGAKLVALLRTWNLHTKLIIPPK
jgi:hypothetical protein